MHHVEQAHFVGIVHRATAVGRETVAKDVDDVDVAGLGGNTFFQNVGGFVHKAEHQALHNFFVRNLAGGDAQALAVVFDHGNHFGVRNRVAFARHVVVPACAGLLAEAAFFTQQVGGLAVLHVWFFDHAAFADGPANVVASQVTHTEWAHGHAEFLHGFVHLGGGAAFVQQEAALAAVLLDHAVANKAVTHTRHHGGLADLLGHSHHGGHHVLGGFGTTHHFQQLHHVGRAEEMQAHHVFRALGECGNRVHVQRGGVGGQDGTGLHHAVQLLEHGFFHANFFKHGFDHHVGGA